MTNFTPARGCRATLAALGLILLGSASALAAPLMPFRAADLVASAAEPFGRPTAASSDNTLREKWQGVAREIEAEALVLALCEEDRSRCASPAALRFLAIVDEGRARDGRARLGDVNRALNLAVRPGDDLALYGATDVWRSPLALLDTGAGDCEDYAIAKYIALRAAGVAVEDLRLVILHDALRHEDHAVAAARLDGRWWLLDNRRMAMVEDINLTNVHPLFVIDDAGIRQYRGQPQIALAQRPAADPAASMKLALRVK
jgi:predicted transglutaminase-like cysteine proteinase